MGINAANADTQREREGGREREKPRRRRGKNGLESINQPGRLDAILIIFGFRNSYLLCERGERKKQHVIFIVQVFSCCGCDRTE